MYQTSTASRQDFPEILGFLERRLLENAWLIWFVHDAFEHPLKGERVVVCRSDGEVVATAHATPWPFRRPEHYGIHMDSVDVGWVGAVLKALPQHYDIHMDSVDAGAVGAVLKTLPDRIVLHAQLFTAETKEYFDALPGAERREEDLYFTVSADDFRPVASEEVRELTRADDGFFDGCGQRPDWEHLAEHTKVFAILRDGRVASWAQLGFMAPPGVVVPRVGAPVGLYTETRYRRQGFARRVVSHITERTLREGHRPIYWTEPENIASQGLCRSLGYRQYAQKVFYVWSKPAEG
jgi:GNAT superfamily N-acetyltransferase